MRSLHEAFETVLQFLEVAAAEPPRLTGALALAAVRTLGRFVPPRARTTLRATEP